MKVPKLLTFSHDNNSWMAHGLTVHMGWKTISVQAARRLFDAGYILIDSIY